MKIPPFSEFTSSLDMDKFSYDLLQASPNSLKRPSNLFTQAQYNFLCQTMVATQISFLAQYHQWLAEQLDK